MWKEGEGRDVGDCVRSENKKRERETCLGEKGRRKGVHGREEGGRCGSGGGGRRWREERFLNEANISLVA